MRIHHLNCGLMAPLSGALFGGVSGGVTAKLTSPSLYLPPSAFEAWFVSAALDDEAVSRVLAALPAAARAAAEAEPAAAPRAEDPAEVST